VLRVERTAPSAAFRAAPPAGPAQVTRYVMATGRTQVYAVAEGEVRSLSVGESDLGGRVAAEYRYYTLGEGGLSEAALLKSGPPGVHHYATFYGYDAAGRAERVRNAVGTVTRTVYDELDRPVQTWVGIDDRGFGQVANGQTKRGDTTLVAEREYDGGVVGDGNLTKVTLHPGVGADRVTRMWYDWRGRLVSTADAANVTYSDLDNFGRATKRRVYEPTAAPGSTNGVPRPPGDGTLLRAQSETLYDARGRAYRSRQRDVRQSDGRVGGALESALWFDGRGNVIKSLQPGGLVSKTAYDGANRPTAQYITDGGGDLSWADADDVNGDIVLSQVETTYDRNGNAIFLTSKERFHNASGTGALTGGNARVSFVANYHDTADRLAQSVDFGTNGGTAPTLQSDGRPALPARVSADGWDPFLRTDYAYDSGGLLEWVTDERGIQTQITYDATGRVKEQIEAYTNGVPTVATDRKTGYVYDGLDHVIESAVTTGKSSGTITRTTKYAYHATKENGSEIDSNDLLYCVIYPNPETGLPAAPDPGDPNAPGPDWELFFYNALGEVNAKLDRSRARHEYVHDPAGRMLSDTVKAWIPPAPLASIDTTVMRHEYEYDALGRAVLLTSKSAGGAVMNQVQRTYDGLDHLVAEHQATGGAVDGDTLAVRYLYETSASGNYSRLIRMAYPTTDQQFAQGEGRSLWYGYGEAGSVDRRIGRVTYIADGASAPGTHLEEYSYVGFDAVVERRHPEPGVSLSYIRQTGDYMQPKYPDGMARNDGGTEATNPYSGLDRFGRVIDQNWFSSVSGNTLERQHYGYDGDSNLLYGWNLRPYSGARSELHQADGVSAGTAYDALSRIKEFQRGNLGQTQGATRLNLILNQDERLTWEVDEKGNWRRVEGTGGRPIVQGDVPPDYSAPDPQPDLGARLFVKYDAWGNMALHGTADLQQLEAGRYGYRNVEVTGNRYDAMGRRIKEDGQSLYYDAMGRVIEERESGVVKGQYVWSPVEESVLALRDADTDGNPATGNLGRSGSGLDQRFYALQDAQGSVLAIADVGGAIQEQYQYTPEGKVTVLNPGGSPLSGSAYGWRYVFHAGRADGGGLYYLNGVEMDPQTGGALKEDAYAYTAAANAYSEWSARNSEVTLQGGWYVATEAARWTSFAAFTLASFGTYTAVLGLARGAATFGGVAVAGGAAGAAYAYATGGNVGYGALAGAEISTALGTLSPRLAARAVEGTGRLALQGAAAAERGALRVADASVAFGRGFARGFSQPLGIGLPSFIDGGAVTGGLRVVRGMRSGLAEASRVRGLRVVSAAESSEEMGVQLGRRFLAEESGLNLRETDWVNPFESASGRSKGFDDVLIDPDGGFWIAEYKGGAGALDQMTGQMGERWVQGVIDRMIEAQSPWGPRLRDAFEAGNLRGITVLVPAPNIPVSVMKVRAYNVGM
jgi:YD repeat-containing protein